jgi:hypothetical protein
MKIPTVKKSLAFVGTVHAGSRHPEKSRIARRLFLIADLMLKTGRERELIERILAAALHLTNEDVPYLKNPFLRRYALDSLSFARDALADGYDPRQNELEWGDDELWD